MSCIIKMGYYFQILIINYFKQLQLTNLAVHPGLYNLYTMCKFTHPTTLTFAGCPITSIKLQLFEIGFCANADKLVRNYLIVIYALGRI